MLSHLNGLLSLEPILGHLVPEDEEGPPVLVEGQVADRRHLGASRITGIKADFGVLVGRRVFAFSSFLP